jgi:predicted nucleic acid-binding protein
MSLKFLDSNIWLYRLLDDLDQETEKKRKIAISITRAENLIISTQVINELSANLIKKAKFNETQIKSLIRSLYTRCQVIEINRGILETASDLRGKYKISFWDGLIVSSALTANANILYSEDMQDGLVISEQLTIINPFK